MWFALRHEFETASTGIFSPLQRDPSTAERDRRRETQWWETKKNETIAGWQVWGQNQSSV